MEYFLFFSLFRKKKMPPKACKVVFGFCLYLNHWWIIFPRVYWIHQEKVPSRCLTSSWSWDVLVFLEPLGTGRSGLVPETIPLVSGTTNTLLLRVARARICKTGGPPTVGTLKDPGTGSQEKQKDASENQTDMVSGTCDTLPREVMLFSHAFQGERC